MYIKNNPQSQDRPKRGKIPRSKEPFKHLNMDFCKKYSNNGGSIYESGHLTPNKTSGNKCEIQLCLQPTISRHSRKTQWHKIIWRQEGTGLSAYFYMRITTFEIVYS